MQYQMQSQKQQNNLSSSPRQTIQYHSNLSLCPNNKCQRSWSWMVLWRPTRPFRTNTQKRCPFHYRGLECESRKSRYTWSNRQIWPWSTEWSRTKANRILPRERIGHSKHSLPTTQETTLHVGITTGSQNKTGSWLWLRSWLLIVKFRLKESKENHQIIQIRPKSNPLWSYSGSEK